MIPPSKIYTRERVLPEKWRYSVIRKALSAISGIILVGFLFGHWNGNRVLLNGEIAFNTYLEWLQNNPLLHYGTWLVIFTSLFIHLLLGSYHWYQNSRARPHPYYKKHYGATTWAARSMVFSGITLLLFLILHLAQVRGWIAFANGGIYQNLQAGFEHWAVLLIYLLGQIALAFHLYHGLWSTFQTLGINLPRYNHLRRPIAALFGIGIAVLNITLILLNLDVIKQILGITT